MVNSQNKFQPDYAASPGEILSVELELRGVTQQELAKRTGITPKHILISANVQPGSRGELSP
jgi:hypothetical protein